MTEESDMSRKAILTLAMGALVSLLTACASKSPASAKAREELDSRLKEQLGIAKKEDLVESLGKADWCKPGENGEETCHFLKQTGNKWIGSTRYQKNYMTYDEVLAVFGQDGKLVKYEVKTQR